MQAIIVLIQKINIKTRILNPSNTNNRSGYRADDSGKNKAQNCHPATLKASPDTVPDISPP